MDSNTPAASVPAAPDTVTWIREPDDLDRWLAEGQGEPLALDTEFERVNTYGPAKALARARRYLPHCETKLVTGE